MGGSIGVGSNGTASPHSSGTKVIVVGTGLGGLSAAVECHRKGHSVVVFDKISEVKRINGDIIGIPANAGRIIAKWGDGAVHQTLVSLLAQTNVAKMHDTAGQEIGVDILEGYIPPGGYAINRGELVWVLLRHAKSLGIDIRLDSPVTDYWESDSEAGVIVHGERITADCVICSDGVHSLARLQVVGHEPTPQNMGIATFRGYFSAIDFAKNPEARWILEGTENQDSILGYFADNAHFIVATLKYGQDVYWMCVHEDVHRSSESWSNNAGDIENAVACIKDWPLRHKLEPIIRQTPKDCFTDRQLIARDPLKTWVSPKQRIILIGDAAHPSLPAGGQGAGQGIEDGAVLAISLELAGKENVPLALCAAEKIRYKRATIIQQGSFVAQAALNNLDWDEVAKNPDMVKTPRQNWIFGHECQDYTYQEFDTVIKAIRDGKEYIPHNIPEDGKYLLEVEYKGIGEAGTK